jgi:hypothetical protein
MAFEERRCGKESTRQIAVVIGGERPENRISRWRFSIPPSQVFFPIYNPQNDEICCMIRMN